MKLVVLKEQEDIETRCAITPQTVKKYLGLNCEVYIENQAGMKAGINDQDYADAGATLFDDIPATLSQADCLITVTAPNEDIISQLKPNACIIGMIQGLQLDEKLVHYNQHALSCFSLELIPRISRAQSMDCLSSQSNLSGYQAVVEAGAHFNRVVPMMMTAAGMIRPAKVLVLGAGVAGLQAIATAKRMGAEVFAFDVRAAAREQVESLAAQFVEVENTEDAETSGGYAKEMGEEYKKRQQALIDQTASDCDIVISTALIPNRPAPLLISKATLNGMKDGSVIVDLATANGGNCECSQVEQVVNKDNKIIIGHSVLARHLALTASELYANNCFNFVALMHENENKAFAINLDDEIIADTLITHQGETVHPFFNKESSND